jgi:hypothetical protein
VFIVLIVLLIVLIALNIKATYVMISSSYYDLNQKLIQLLLIWLLPGLGAILILSLANEIKTEKVTTDLRDHGGNGDGHVRPDNSSIQSESSDADGSD